MFVAITALQSLVPKLPVMILLAGPVPVIIWFVLAHFFASRSATPAAGVPQ